MLFQLRLAESKNKEKFTELPLYMLKEQYNKTKEGKKFVTESILGSALSVSTCKAYIIMVHDGRFNFILFHDSYCLWR